MGFSLESFPLPLGDLDRLRRLIVALPLHSRYTFGMEMANTYRKDTLVDMDDLCFH